MELKVCFLAAGVVAGLLVAPPSAVAQTMVDEGLAVGVQCAGGAVNDTGQEVGACRKADGSIAPFVALTPGTTIELPRLAAGANCAASAITDGGVAVGGCKDATSVRQAVVWTNLSGTPAVRRLQPLVGGVHTVATAFNQEGAVAGVSLDGSDTASQVLWRAGLAGAITLPVGLPGFATANCAPSDVADGSGTTPAVLGNCPDGAGHSLPLYWTATVVPTVYVANRLTLPPGAVACVASMLVNGRVLGTCDFGANGSQTAVWTSVTNSPVVLTVTDGITHLRNSGTAINSGGEVVGAYVTIDGLSLPYHWRVATDTFTPIAPLTDGKNATALAIGDNGIVAGNSETSGGTTHAFLWRSGYGTADVGTLSGGDNSAVRDMSKSGCWIAGFSEVSGHGSHAFVENLCEFGARQAAGATSAKSSVQGYSSART